MLIRGIDLHPIDRQHVLATYVHRYTGDHKPNWAKRDRANDKPYLVQFANDQEWLEHSYFTVTKQGRLDKRVKRCESNPTWPDNPELRIQGGK